MKENHMKLSMKYHANFWLHNFKRNTAQQDIDHLKPFDNE